MSVSFYRCGVGDLLFVFFVCLVFTFLGKSWSPPAWRQTLTDTELSESHEFDVVGNLRAFDARRLGRETVKSRLEAGGLRPMLSGARFYRNGTTALQLTSLKVTFLLA